MILDYTPISLVAIFFIAAILQTLSGFGFAVITMPLVCLVLDWRTAAPLVAMVALTLYTINIVRYRHAVNWREVARLGIASAIGVPLGVWALVNANESLVKTLLGAILIGYALYALVRPGSTRAISRHWAVPAGLLSGCLGGAYNTPGPPLIVYASLRQWGRDEFRASLQTLFFISGALTTASHFVVSNVTPLTLRLYALVVPALALGLATGMWLDRRVDQERFRVIVTAMILVLGVLLVIQ